MYSESFDGDQQVSAEERIASLIFDFSYEGDWRPSEEECQKLSQQILLSVLEEFRPDLLDLGAEEEEPTPNDQYSTYTCKICNQELHFDVEEYDATETLWILYKHLFVGHNLACENSSFVEYRDFIASNYTFKN